MPNTNITQDLAGRGTARFGGIQWASPNNNAMSRGYVQNKWEEVTTTHNEAKYGDFIPLHYGEGWNDPLVLTTDGSDANFTKMHVLLGWGQFTEISRVLVNGTAIPHTFDDTEMAYVPAGVSNTTAASKSGWWKCINNGDRTGAIAYGIALSEQPDPYGNMCVIEVVVPRKLADSSSAPRVQVLAKGAQIRVWYNANPGGGTLDSGSGFYWRKEYTDNLAWILLDVLTWANWRYRQINIQSFMDYAYLCSNNISYKDQFGSTSTHPRYTCSLILRQRRNAGDVVRGLRNAGNCLLYLDSTGKLTARHLGTLASQQPSPVAGSNYSSAVASKSLAGGAASGYVAYDFHDGNIAKKKDGKTPSFSIKQPELQDAPNKVSFNYQDRDNRFVPDTLTLIDAEDVARVGQETVGQFLIDGINNQDQGRRCSARWLAEGYRGNARLSAYGSTIGDTGGTLTYEFETTFKVIHLNVGDICRLSYAPKGISNQLVRVKKLQPDTNFSRCKVTVSFHNDLWYTDDFGQALTPDRWKPEHHNQELRPSFGWCPNMEEPPAGDSVYEATRWTFRVWQEYDVDAQGNAIARLNVQGRTPVNEFGTVTPPFLPIQGTTANTGGTIKGGRTYWFMVCAKDTDGLLSAPSKMLTIAVPAGTNTNTVTVPVTLWDSATQGWALYGGDTPHRFSFQSEGTGKPASIPLTAWNESLDGVPDGEFDALSMELFNVRHSGCWGAEVLSCTSSTIQMAVLPGAGFTTNQWAGYDVTLLGQRGADGVALPIYNARVQSNTSDTLTLASGAPDPTALLQPKDVLVCRFKPTVGDDWIEDANLVNNLNGLGDAYSVLDATNATPIQVTVAGEHNLSSGDWVYITGATGNTAANGLWQVTVLTPDTYQLQGSAGNASYAGGATAYRMQRGMNYGAEAGNFLYFYGGTGAGNWVKISDNTDIRFTIEGSWPVVPDATSRFVVVSGNLIGPWLQQGVNNSSKDAMSQWNVDVTNNRGQVLLVRCNTLDGGGMASLEPITREVYLFGLPPGERRISADAVVQKTDRTLLVNASTGDVNVTLRPIAEMAGFSLTLIREDSSSNTVTVIAVAGDTINGSSTVTLDVGSTLTITGTS